MHRGVCAFCVNITLFIDFFRVTICRDVPQTTNNMYMRLYYTYTSSYPQTLCTRVLLSKWTNIYKFVSSTANYMYIHKFVSAHSTRWRAPPKSGMRWCPYASEGTASSNRNRLSSMQDRHVLVISRVVTTRRLDLKDLNLHFVELQLFRTCRYCSWRTFFLT